MQLESPKRLSVLRTRLGAAAGALLAMGVPAAAQADGPPTWQVDAATLYYSERSRTSVFEPFVRVTRMFADGQSLSGKLSIDTMTGATPTGALPSGQVHTTTTASGRVSTTAASDIPTTRFRDRRYALDLDWTKPIAGTLASTLGGHVSREKDYESLGWSGKVSVDCMGRLTTLTAGAGANYDRVMPVGGTREGLTDGATVLHTSANSKETASWLLGVSRILTRQWMMSVNASRYLERGYLSEPYKVVSLEDPLTGAPQSQVMEKRPSRRNRSDVLTSSVYHFAEDVLYASHRYYWDDWGVRSHTVDLKYRYELEDNRYFQPHLRYYSQSPADFFTFGLKSGEPLPSFASADYRLGRLHSLTMGLTYGFRLPGYPGELSVRGEYIRQSGVGRASPSLPASVGGEGDDKALPGDSGLNTVPSLDITTLVVAYSVEF
jgi:hypothetical protein